ncbi:hypothetical protein ACGVWS_07790 [Enterobacteriaceae bacterium LUAb1]
MTKRLKHCVFTSHPLNFWSQRRWSILAGILSGLILCFALSGRIVNAGTEMFLPSHEINLSGKVTAPSCTVKLEKTQLNFTHAGAVTKRSGPEKLTQTLRLHLSQCETDGVGIMFKAEYWPDNKVRGKLQDKETQEYSTAWYYTIGPETENETIWPLYLAENSPRPEVDKQRDINSHERYFNLAEVNYWYDLKTPLKENSDLAIPFNVSVHHDIEKEDKNSQNELGATFTLQLSWR